MAIIDNNNNTLTNVLVGGDLDGYITSPTVISIRNVTTGVLNIRNGGLGITSFPYGKIPIGNIANEISFLEGTEDYHFIKWSTSLNSWVVGEVNNLTDLNINLSNNQFFNITSSIDSFGIKTFEITQKSFEPNKILATDTINGYVQVRELTNEDIPVTLENKTLNFASIANSTFSEVDITSGYINGTHSGQFSGDFSGNFAGNYSGSYYGNGEFLSSIKPENIIDLDSYLLNLLNQQSSISFSNLYVSNLLVDSIDISGYNTYNGIFNGNFIGDGSQLNNLDINQISGIDDYILGKFRAGDNITIENGIISSNNLLKIVPGNNLKVETQDNITYEISLNNELDYLDNITATSIIADNIQVNTLNINNIQSNEFQGSFIGDGSGLTNIRNDSLQNKSIIINGNEIDLGSSIDLNLSASITFGNNITGSVFENVYDIQIVENPSFSNITADNIQSLNISSSYLSGDGSGIYNIDPDNISGLIPIIQQNARTFDVDKKNVLINNFNEIYLNDDLSDINSLYVNSIFSSDIVSDQIDTNIIYADSFIGDGSLLQNISITNVIGLQSYISQTLTNLYKAGTGISIGNDGTISVDPQQQTNVLDLSPGLNINLVNYNGIYEVSTKENLLLFSLSSSFISSSNYSGDGSNIKNINYSNISNPPSLSLYATTSSLNSLSSSVSSSLNNYLLKSLTSSFAASGNYAYASDLTSLSSSLSLYATTSSLNVISSSVYQSLDNLSQLITQVSSSSIQNTPYDIAGEATGSIPSGSLLMNFLVPRTFIIQEFLQYTGSDYAPAVLYKNGNLVSYPTPANKNDLLTVYSSGTGSFAYYTVRGLV